ncbi:lamin tail domain-containing protein [Candidatus Nomurabacteria bacterium]|nr:lamin tail domain-containing protein [Candidatus Nomurabacteria bacterium]
MKKAVLLSIICLLVFSATKIAQATEADLLISEIMYDLSGGDAGHEWVEIFNSGNEEIEVLTGAGSDTWRFFDGTNHTLNLAQGEDNLIVPGEYFIIAADAEQFLQDYPEFSGTVFDTVMSLANTTGELALSFDGGETYLIQATYDSAWGGSGSGKSLEKINLNQDSSPENWQESFVIGGTPGLENSHDDGSGEESDQPLAVAICPTSLLLGEEGLFDASQSIDPQNLPLTYLWDFLDGTTITTVQATHTFVEANNYNVSLTVSNGELEAYASCLVTVTAEDQEEEDGGGGENGGGNNGGGNPPPQNHWQDIIVSEFLPNPTGVDDGEWIELYNKGEQRIDLSGFALQDNSARIFTISEDDNLSIGANTYLVLEKSVTGVSLNNAGGDAVKLYDPEGSLLEQISYIDTALENKSYARENIFQNNFLWTAELTPGTENIFVANLAPEAVIKLLSENFLVGEKIKLSAEDSSDPEEGTLEYFWDFGDETSGDEKIENHQYSAAGNYLVKLKVSDSEGLSGEASLLLNIFEAENNLEIKNIQVINFELGDLIISEFIPNPVGSDDGEWIEVCNNFSEPIDLLGWYLDDQDGGSRPYLFATSTIILPGEFKIFSRSETGVTLNNSEDSVRLLNPLQEVWQEVNYNKIPEGQSYAWDFENLEWFVNKQASPGSVNQAKQDVAGFSLLNPPAIYDQKIKANVILQGLAINDANPKSASLYLVDWDQEEIYYDQPVEIYFSKKDWPEIKAGDLVEVSGEISKLDPLPRVKIKSKEDLLKTEFHLDLAAPELISTDDLSEDLLGDFLHLKGIIVKKSGKNIYLASEEEEDWQVRVYANFDLSDLEISKGQEMIVAGILSETSSGFKLLPLNKNDLQFAQKVEAAINKEPNKQVEISEEVYQVENDLRSEKIKKNLLFIICGSLILLIIFSLKKKFSK